MCKLLLGLAGAIPAVFLLSMAAADAQQGCGPRGGDPSCPEFVVIAPSTATDGSVAVQANVSTTLFGGITPPNGFIVQLLSGGSCYVNDNGAAAFLTGFNVINNGSPFVTPLGYKPMGPVSIFCNPVSPPAPIPIEARAW